MEKKPNRICIITNHYPTESNPAYAFVDQLACGFADLGVDCAVIAPQSISRRFFRKAKKMPEECVKITENGNKIKIFRPEYISLSGNILNIDTAMITYKFFKRSAYNELVKRGLSPDILYGQFIYPSGMCAADIGKKLNIPSFLDYGESSPSLYNNISKSVLQKILSHLSGVIAVSGKNKKEFIDMELVPDESIVDVFLNGVDHHRFYQIDRKSARETLGIEKDVFVVAFLGRFSQRKGIKVLSNVLNQLEDVYSILIGGGEDEPDCKNILFKGRVPHQKVAMYLNAADVFVLPTDAEGCCNAIIEAMACGLPVISSDQPFNDDILNDSNSIRLDVKDENAIKEAIVQLKDNPILLRSMSESALNSASELDIKKRAASIIGFMESKI